MSVYDDLTFAPVLLGDMFVFRRGRVGSRSESGNTPYIGAAARNNSMVGLLDDPPEFPGGWLAIVNNGDGGAGYCTYQPAPFAASADVTVLKPRFEASDVAKVVLASAITFQCFPKYTFGYKPNIQRLTRQKIMVPVTVDDSGDQAVDWEGMTRLGEEMMAQAITRLHSVRSSDVVGIDADLPDLRFEPMLITDVFETMKSSSAWYDKSKLHPGQGIYPFVSRTKASNGTDGFTALQGKSPELGGAVTIGLDTQTIAYQPVPFYTSQNIQVLRHPRLDADNALLLVSCLREQMGKFSWGGNGATLGRLKATRIMVPVTADECGDQVIDWAGMTLYGKILRARAERQLSTPTTVSG